MAGIHGNTAWLMFKKQTAKGTPATAGEAAESSTLKQTCFRVPFTGGNIEPARSFGNLAETDANRDQGVSYAKTGGVAGTPEMYTRDTAIGALLTYCLGADAVTGTTPNRIHTITPANNIPYVTFWRDIGDTLFERFQDCFVSSLNFKATAGEPLTVAANVLGVKTTRLETDPSVGVTTIPLEKGYVFNYNDATVSLAGSATGLISSFDLTIDNNVSSQQTDDFSPYDVTAGQRVIDLSFDIIFESLEQYEKFNYGSGALKSERTAESNELFQTSSEFNFAHGANNGVKFILPSIAYESFPVAPNTTGAPIVASVKAVAQRSTPIITAEVKTQVESY